MFRPVPSSSGPLAWRRARGRPLVFAHRGASHGAAENSLAALRLALEEGADGVEFDVQRCASGELVVFHDRTLGRCLGRPGLLGETPLGALKRLSLDRVDRLAGRRPGGERVPTLEEWLEAAPRGLLLNLEAKVDEASAAGLGGACARALAAAGRLDESLLSAFHPAALWSAKGACEGLPRGTLVEPNARWKVLMGLGRSSGVAALHPHHSLVSEERVKRWHGSGLAVLVWTVDDEDEARRCLEAGVDALITNVPGRMRRLCERFTR